MVATSRSGVVTRKSCGSSSRAAANAGRNLAARSKLGLRVVTGFIENGLGTLSGQIDCMLVRGSGREIPYTVGYVWHIKDVVAVFEIKKQLYGNDLADAYVHLAGVKALEREYYISLKDDNSPAPDMTPALRAYSQITGQIPPPPNEQSSMPPTQRILLSTLLSERFSAIRIIFGYTGFKSEQNFRDSLYGTLSEHMQTPGYGVGTFPQLIVSGEYAMVKANGMPYTCLAEQGEWAFYCSTRANPLLLMLELIWTRLNEEYGIAELWGEDLELEVMHAYLSAHVAEQDGKFGWAMTYHGGTDVELDNLPVAEEWMPTFITSHQAAIIGALCKHGSIDFGEPSLLDWLTSEGIDPSEF